MAGGTALAGRGNSDPANVPRVGGALPRGPIVLRRRPKDWTGVLRRFDVGVSRGDGSPRCPNSVPAHFGPPHILPSRLLDKDARRDASGHSAKTSKDKTDSLDAGGILVNAKRSDTSNCARSSLRAPSSHTSGFRRGRWYWSSGISRKWLKLRIGSINRSAGATDSSSGWFRKMPDAQRRRRLQQWAR